MGLIFGLVKRLIRIFIYFLIFAAIVVLIPNLPPYTKFTAIPLEPPLPRTGPLALNNALNNADKAYVDKLLGPEAFQLYKGELYTSLATGEIVKVSPGGHVTFVTKIGQPCSELKYEHICGRPLGFQIDESKNLLYVADAYLGIWKVDLKNDKKQRLVAPGVPIEGREPKLFNSIALGKNGDLYWTDSTSEFQLKDGAIAVLLDPSGRVFHYDAANNKNKVLLDNLWFANGLVVSPDNEFLIIAEASRFRLLKYYLSGPKKGKSEVFVAGLPGTPDNVRALPDGSGILVGLYVATDEEYPLLMRPLAGAPLARKFLARLQRLIEIPFEYLNTVYPHPVLEDIVYYIGHFNSLSGTLPKNSGLLQIDWNGNIIASYYNNDGSVVHVSDAVVFNGKLHTGNPHMQNFIGTVQAPPLLKRAFETKQAKPADTPKVEVKREAPKPTQTKPVEPKPTPKPEQPKPAKPVEQPKPTPKPKVKPVEQPKPTPKPTAKPVEQPKPTPKAAAPKPVEQPKPTPKPVEQPKPSSKPVEQPKATPKPVEQPKATPKPVEQPKATPKPAEQPKPVQPKPTTPPPAKTEPKVQPKQDPKREAKIPPAKPSPSKTESKPAPAKPEAKVGAKSQATKAKEAPKPVKDQPKESKPEQIPIKEEIPSDTAKPTKETLKVIKKGGPTEIPNPNL